jgi:YVTN family beta-propeller protein
MKRALFAVLALASCGPPQQTNNNRFAPAVSSTIALTSDDKELWVVSPDADSVSAIDPAARAVTAEILLGKAPPAVDGTTMRYEPAVKPRALAILPGDKKVYVAGQTANAVFVVDAVGHSLLKSIPVGAAPVGVVAAQDGSAVYAVSHEAALVTKIDPTTDQVVATLTVGEHPWGASIGLDGATLYVTHLLLHPGVTVIDLPSFSVRTVTELHEQAPDAAGPKVPNGVARGVYAAVPRPQNGALWLPHMLLAVKTPEPTLQFDTTVFPTISILGSDGSEGQRLLFKPLMVPNAGGAFSDSISGPRALAFSPDGKLALLANAGSEDLMVFNGDTGNEVSLVRPLAATFLEGVTVDHAGVHAYVDGRNSHNVVVLALHSDDATAPVVVDGDPIDRLKSDPMPPTLRQGQRLFYTANSSVLPITQNFWVSCSSCHLEGYTDAVTWLFAVGPRDTPSNAGGPVNTGFLLRQALRNSIEQYDVTINIEQGGKFDHTNAMQKSELDVLAQFVNYAIPFPQNPNLASDGKLTDAQTRGQGHFNDLCASCHSGDYLTDSAKDNPTLDLAGKITLHDIGTCVTGGSFPDVATTTSDVDHQARTACDFDTPTLRGIFATAPYFHDGSAATLADAVARVPYSAGLSPDEQADLVAYLKTL